MEQRSLRFLDTNKTFFSKLTSTITKMLIPTKVSINGMMISIKRNNLIKAYSNYEVAVKEDDIDKKDSLFKKYEEAYSLYLEAIDKYIMDSVYKKVKNNTASEFEKNALAKYYMVVSLKQNQYIEYKYKKQEYLLKVDYESVINLKKQSTIDKYNEFYVAKMDSLYKGLLKNYSIQLADTVSSKVEEINNIYIKIFKCLEDYISDILPIKMRINNGEEYKNILNDYDKYETMQVGKQDERDIIRKQMVLLGISRELFTHSLPLIVAEQCYIKLLKDVRSLIVDTKVLKIQEKAYSLLIRLIEDYNIKLLSTKIYWDKPAKRDEYKAFWKKYQEIEKTKETNKEEYLKQKEILFIRGDLKEVYQNENKYYKIIKFYKNKLVELGAMKELKNKCISEGSYVERKALCRK